MPGFAPIFSATALTQPSDGDVAQGVDGWPDRWAAAAQDHIKRLGGREAAQNQQQNCQAGHPAILLPRTTSISFVTDSAPNTLFARISAICRSAGCPAPTSVTAPLFAMIRIG
ncbi:MAG: hypothetical protein HS123_15930 [Solibacteraceae bacterium]|nr:hypothetical protein [Solibacteraceae bacterium]